MDVEKKGTRLVRLVGKSIVPVLVAGFMTATAVTGCKKPAQESGAYPVTDKKADCLPPITLIDQNGHQVSLASFKGKPVLFDFIYTTCPGPCLVLTARMRAVANRLGNTLGTKVRFVSITVDPEHDRPPELLKYAQKQGADLKGWSFLTGTPQQIEEVMARFKLRRKREADGSIDHVLEFFLVGADGHPLVQYLASQADPTQIADDLQHAASGHSVVGSAAGGAPGFSS